LISIALHYLNSLELLDGWQHGSESETSNLSFLSTHQYRTSSLIFGNFHFSGMQNANNLTFAGPDPVTERALGVGRIDLAK
jgi:hypothetical protein